MNPFFKYFSTVALVAVAVVALTLGSGCNNGQTTTNKPDSSHNAKVESLHSFFDHYGALNEVQAFFAPEVMKSHKVKQAKFFDHFSGKPDFAKDLPDEIKHLDTEGRIVKEEFLTIDSTTYAYGSESWKYDNAGRIVESTVAYPNSTKVTQVTYSYDAEGRILAIDTRSYTSVEPDSALHYKLVHQISYVGKGNIPTQITHKKDDAEIGQVSTKWLGDTLVYQYKGEQEMEVRFMCDTQGRVLQMMEIDQLPTAINKKHVYGYDGKSNVNSKDEHVMQNGQYSLINKTVWTYNEAGLLSHEEVYAMKGSEKSLVDKSVVEYTYYE